MENQSEYPSEADASGPDDMAPSQVPAGAVNHRPTDAPPSEARPVMAVRSEALVERLIAGLERWVARQRASDPDLLSVEEVASALRCSTDTVRRIPIADLPYYRVGKANLYFREDLLAFVRTKGASGSNTPDAHGEKPDDLATKKEAEDPPAVDRFVGEMLGLRTVDASTPAERRAE